MDSECRRKTSLRVYSLLHRVHLYFLSSGPWILRLCLASLWLFLSFFVQMSHVDSMIQFATGLGLNILVLSFAVWLSKLLPFVGGC